MEAFEEWDEKDSYLCPKETFHFEKFNPWDELTITVMALIHLPVFYLKHDIINHVGVVAPIQRQRLGETESSLRKIML
jgi:hypothetical protein